MSKVQLDFRWNNKRKKKINFYFFYIIFVIILFIIIFYSFEFFYLLINHYCFEKRSIEIIFWSVSRPEFRFKILFLFLFWVNYPKIYIHICNGCIRSAMPYSGDPEDILLILKCKNCKRWFFFIIFAFQLNSFDFIYFFFLIMSNNLYARTHIHLFIHVYIR